MKVFYLKTCDNIKECANNKFIYLLKRTFFIFTLKEEFIIFPILKNEKMPELYNKVLARKVNKVLEKLKAGNIVLENELIKNNWIEKLDKKYKIVNGRKIFEILSLETIKYIAIKKHKLMQELEVSIMIQEKNDIFIKNIINIAKNVRTLNIVTTNIKYFKILEDKLYDEYGIAVRVSNNKKKVLLKSDVIINIDFSYSLLNMYNFPANGIIVNIKEKNKIDTKQFNGINANFIKTNFECKYNDFEPLSVYEARIYNSNYEKMREQIVKDKIEVVGLIGNNGIISNKEFN